MDGISVIGSSRYQINLWDQSSTEIHRAPVLIVGQISGNWVIQQPVALALERDEDGSYLVVEDAFDIYGHGATIEEAREDFISALIEYHAILKQYADQDQASKEVLEKFTTAWLAPA